MRYCVSPPLIRRLAPELTAAAANHHCVGSVGERPIALGAKPGAFVGAGFATLAAHLVGPLPIGRGDHRAVRAASNQAQHGNRSSHSERSSTSRACEQVAHLRSEEP